MSLRTSLGGLKYRIQVKLTRAVVTPRVAAGTRRLIVFLTPGFNSPNGGILTIARICDETAAIRDVHGARAALCAVPGDPPLIKYTWFRNDHYILNFEELVARCGQLDYLLVHIPEYAVGRVGEWLDAHKALFQYVTTLHLNVLVQHIDNSREQDIAGLARFGLVTATTAHEAYTTAATRAALGVPLHRLSCPNGPERYAVSSYAQKDPVLMVSHDEHPLKAQVLALIRQARPELTIQVIHNLSFEQYLDVARRAKWSLTFGEGLDSYFSDPTFSGGVSFAVFNDRFFTPAFAALETVYPSWDTLMARIAADLGRLDEPVAYERCWRQAWQILADLYSVDRFRDNLRLFHRGEYTFP